MNLAAHGETVAVIRRDVRGTASKQGSVNLVKANIHLAINRCQCVAFPFYLVEYHLYPLQSRTSRGRPAPFGPFP